MSTDHAATPHTGGSVLSCRVPASPEITDLVLGVEGRQIVLEAHLRDPRDVGRTVTVRAERVYDAPMSWTTAWLDGQAVEQLGVAIAARFDVTDDDGACLEHLLERVVDLAGMSWEARGDAGVADVASQVQAALRNARGGDRP